MNPIVPQVRTHRLGSAVLKNFAPPFFFGRDVSSQCEHRRLNRDPSGCAGMRGDRRGGCALGRGREGLHREEGSECYLGDIIKFCGTQLSSYKVPKQIEFRTSLPKTNVGKILCRELRDEM